jgi:hypothetical protein
MAAFQSAIPYPRILKTSAKPDSREVFTPPFLRSLYVRFDEDCDGRLSLREVRSLVWLQYIFRCIH